MANSSMRWVMLAGGAAVVAVAWFVIASILVVETDDAPEVATPTQIAPAENAPTVGRADPQEANAPAADATAPSSPELSEDEAGTDAAAAVDDAEGGFVRRAIPGAEVPRDAIPSDVRVGDRIRAPIAARPETSRGDAPLLGSPRLDPLRLDPEATGGGGNAEVADDRSGVAEPGADAARSERIAPAGETRELRDAGNGGLSAPPSAVVDSGDAAGLRRDPGTADGAARDLSDRGPRGGAALADDPLAADTPPQTADDGQRGVPDVEAPQADAAPREGRRDLGLGW